MRKGNCNSASVHIKKGELDCVLQLLQGALLVLEVPLPYPGTHCWHWALQATVGKQSDLFFWAALRPSVLHQKKSELVDAQHWLSEVLAMPYTSNIESLEGVMQATTEFDQTPAVVQAVQQWATALGHLAHNEVQQQAVEMLQQVCLFVNVA